MGHWFLKCFRLQVFSQIKHFFPGQIRILQFAEPYFFKKRIAHCGFPDAFPDERQDSLAFEAPEIIPGSSYFRFPCLEHARAMQYENEQDSHATIRDDTLNNRTGKPTRHRLDCQMFHHEAELACPFGFLEATQSRTSFDSLLCH
jgi:hypothetical protein